MCFGFTFLDVPSNNTSTVESSSTHDPQSRILLSRREAVATLGVSLSHFRRFIQPQMPCVQCGQLILYRPRDLQEWADRLAGVPPAFTRGRRSTISRAGGSPSALASPAPLRPNRAPVSSALPPMPAAAPRRARARTRRRTNPARRPPDQRTRWPSMSYAIRSLAQRTSANAVAANPVTSREYGILDAVGP